MQEVGIVSDKNGQEIVGGKQYSSKSGSAGRTRVEEAGGKEGRVEGDLWKRFEVQEEGRLV